MATDKPTMNVVFVGHVDHGKSTCVGQLMFQSGVIPEQEMKKLKEEAEKQGKPGFEFAYIMDHIKEERERGAGQGTEGEGATRGGGGEPRPGLGHVAVAHGGEPPRAYRRHAEPVATPSLGPHVAPSRLARRRGLEDHPTLRLRADTERSSGHAS